MTGTLPERKVQLGIEGTPGTEVNTDVVWRGTGQLADAREWVDAEENIGILPMTTAQILTKTEGAIELSGPLTAEQAPYLLGAAIDSKQSGVQDGVGRA